MIENLIERELVKTVDKRELLATLRDFREESREHLEVNLINDLIELIDSGELDG